MINIKIKTGGLMKKVIFCLVIVTLLSVVCLNAHSDMDRGCIFTCIPLSTVNAGIGYESGVADIWHHNAFSAWNNPALSSFHPGLIISSANDDLFDELEGLNEMIFSSSYINLAYKGLGVNLPFINLDNRIGTSLDYGKDELINSNQEIVATFRSYETAKNFNFSINSSVLNSSKPEIFVIGTGITVSSIYSKLYPEGVDENGQTHKAKGKGTIYNIGFIGKLDLTSFLNNENYILEGSLGYVANNFNNKKIDYNDFQSEIIVDNQYLGFGIYSAISNKDYFSDNQIISMISKNLVSGMLLYSNTYSYNTNPIQSCGAEIGFLDTFFIREGYFDNPDGHISGNTFGFGVKLNYFDYGFCEYNYASYPGGELQKTLDKWDISAGISLNKFLKF